MNQILNPAQIAAPLGQYSHAILSNNAGSWLHIAGQIGVAANGQLEDGFEAQAAQSWRNLVAILHAAGMDVSNLVKVTSYLTDANDVPRLAKVRESFLGSARPASTLLVVQALANPSWLFEVDAVAFLPNAS